MAETITLRGMTWSDPRGFDPVVAAAKAFQQSHENVSISWDKRSLQGFESTPVEELAATYDFIVVDHPHVGAVVAHECLLPLERHGDAATLARLQAETVGKSFQSYFFKGHQWAVPIDAATQVQAIRPDLRAAPLHNMRDVLALARAGQVVWPLRPPHVLMSFFSLAANIGAPCAVTPGPLLARASGLKVLVFMRELYSALDPACHDMDPIAALDSLAQGNRFSLCPLVYLYAPYAADNYRPHRIAFHDMPALGDNGPLGSALGGTGCAVSARTAHPELCTEFALWLASAAVQRGLYSDNNGQPGNAIAWGDTEVNAAKHKAYAQSRMTHEAAWLRPRHDGYMGFQEEGSHILLDALTGKTNANSALDALDKRFIESFPA